MEIIKKPIKYNFSSRGGKKIKKIVIHDTGNPRRGADAMAHYHYFNGGDRSASAHYFVDDKQVVQTVPDYLSAWHVGDGKGKYGITNQESIGIEICINEDGNYEKTVENTLWLTKHLMDKYGLTIDDVVRHYDASRKRCPGTMEPNDWQKWHEFKRALKGENVIISNPTDTYDGTVIASVLNVRSGPGTDYDVVYTLNRGDKVKINSKNGDWYEIDHKRFVSAKYIKVLKEDTAVAKKDEPSKWHKDAWEWAVLNQITDGTEPKRPATREEVVTMIKRAIHSGE